MVKPEATATTKPAMTLSLLCSIARAHAAGLSDYNYKKYFFYGNLIPIVYNNF